MPPRSSALPALAIPLLWSLSLQGCTVDEGEEAGTTTDNSGTGTETETGSDTITGDGDGEGDGDGDTTGDGDGEPPPTPDACGCDEGEVCVGLADSACAFGSGFSLICIDASDCLGPCTCETVCGEACVPSCDYAVSVDFWCDSLGGLNDCDVLEQNCPDGEKCVPTEGFDDNTCVPAGGDAAAGEPCFGGGGGEDNCDANSWCYAANGGEPTCQPFCTPEAECEDPDQSCGIFNSGVIAMCLDNCNPTEVEACVEGSTCAPNAEGEQPFVCLPGGSNGLGQGDPCNFVNDCSPGLGCFSADYVDGCESNFCCSSYCELDDPDACAGLEPMMCLSYFDPDPPPAGFEQLGLCGIQP